MKKPVGVVLRKQDFIYYLLITWISFFYLINMSNGHDWGGDFSMYIMHAKNIVSGTPYAQTNYVYNVDTSFYGPKAYPPIFPLLLAPFVAIWGVNLKVLKLIGVISFILLLLYLSERVVPRYFSPILKVIFIITLGLYPPFFAQADSIMSDIPFILFCVISLRRMNDQTSILSSDKTKWLQSCLTGILIYLAYGTRTLGICLIPVLLLLDWKKNKKISLATIITIGSAFALIMLQFLLIPETGNYADQLPKSLLGIISMLVASFLHYFGMYASISTIIPFHSYIIQTIVFLVVLELVIVGLFVRLKQTVTSYELFFLVYNVALLFWPSYQGMRFILPMIPFYFLFFLEGVQFLFDRVKKYSLWVPRILSLSLLLFILFSYHSIFVSLIPRTVSDIERQETQELFHFVQNETTSKDVIAFFKPRVLALFTDRKSVALAVPAPNGDALQRIKDLNVSTLIVRLNYSYESQPELIQLIQESPEYFELIFENDDFRVYTFAD